MPIPKISENEKIRLTLVIGFCLVVLVLGVAVHLLGSITNFQTSVQGISTEASE